MTPTPKPDNWPAKPLKAIPDGTANVLIWGGVDAYGRHVATVHGPRNLPAAEARDAAIDLARQFVAAPRMLAMLEDIADRVAGATGQPEFTTGDKAALDALIAEAWDGVS